MSVSPIPKGYHTATPYLIIRNAAEAIEFYKKAFAATELLRLDGPGGTLGHAEIKIGDSPIMVSDEWPDYGYVGPQTLGGSPVSICLYVEDVDAMFRQAIDAGAQEVKPLRDEFYGDRTGTVKDPYGHVWTIATHKEDLTPEQLRERYEEFMKQHAA